MIVRDKPNAFKLFFILRGSIVPHILPQIVVITLIGVLVAGLQQSYPGLFPNYSTAPFALPASPSPCFWVFVITPATTAGGRPVSCGVS